MRRGAVPTAASLLAGQNQSLATAGQFSPRPAVAGDTLPPSQNHPSRKAWSVFASRRHGKGSTRKRLLQAAVSGAVLGAAAVFASTAAFGLFKVTTTTQTNTLAAGTVTLSSTAISTCNVTNMLPGTSPTPCTLKATYSGTVSAYIGLDVLIATKAIAPGTIALYNPSDSTNALQITISDNQSPTPVTYVQSSPATNFGSAISCPSPYNSGGYTCYQLTDLLVSKTPFTSSSAAVTFTTSVTLPVSSPTGYQYGTAWIDLTAHAVQSSNNAATGCNAGSPCPTVPWS